MRAPPIGDISSSRRVAGTRPRRAPRKSDGEPRPFPVADPSLTLSPLRGARGSELRGERGSDPFAGAVRSSPPAQHHRRARQQRETPRGYRGGAGRGGAAPAAVLGRVELARVLVG